MTKDGNITKGDLIAWNALFHPDPPPIALKDVKWHTPGKHYRGYKPWTERAQKLNQ